MEFNIFFMVLLKSIFDIKDFWDSHFIHKKEEEVEVVDWLHSQIKCNYGTGQLQISKDD